MDIELDLIRLCRVANLLATDFSLVKGGPIVMDRLIGLSTVE